MSAIVVYIGILRCYSSDCWVRDVRKIDVSFVYLLQILVPLLMRVCHLGGGTIGD